MDMKVENNINTNEYLKSGKHLKASDYSKYMGFDKEDGTEIDLVSFEKLQVHLDECSYCQERLNKYIALMLPLEDEQMAYALKTLTYEAKLKKRMFISKFATNKLGRRILIASRYLLSKSEDKIKVDKENREERNEKYRLNNNPAMAYSVNMPQAEIVPNNNEYITNIQYENNMIRVDISGDVWGDMNVILHIESNVDGVSTSVTKSGKALYNHRNRTAALICGYEGEGVVSITADVSPAESDKK